MAEKPVPAVLSIAGSDSGGGAGIQADLKAFAAAGAHGMSALVALTAQSTAGVTAIQTLPPDFVRAQLDACFDDIGVDAAKTGMLFSRELIETVAGYLESRPVPLVVDPVMVASSGARLLEDLESYGLVVPRPGSAPYDNDAIVIARTAAELASFGIEPRHLRAFKTAADREVGLVEQVSAPIRRSRERGAEGRAEEVTGQIAALSVRLHATLVRVGLRRLR